MQKFNTKGIVLARTNYGESARIITFLTPDHGKVKAIAKGVRKPKSKLAGGIELLSVSQIGILAGRGEVDTLVSSRLVQHFANIVKELTRTDLAYKLIKLLDKATEEEPEAAYFELLQKTFESLDDQSLGLELVEAWFGAQLLKLAGHTPNLTTEKSGTKLTAAKKYDFDYEAVSFVPGKTYGADQIKFTRLLFSSYPPSIIQKIQGADGHTSQVQGLVRSVLQEYIRI